jgi:Flp pilus assembly protein CpaB
MKQKNLAMLGVAVGCGLVAAVAVAKLSAGSTRAPETTKVLVAKRDLPVQTTLDEKELDNLLGWADMPKNLVPPDACMDIEAVKGKTLQRTLKQGNPLSITDIGSPKKLILPDGFKAMSVHASQVDAVAGFVKPGDRVDILYTERMQGTGKTRSAILLRKMLVLAVNMTNSLDEKTGPAIPQVESVSLAVNDWQGNRLTLAEEKGRLKLMLTAYGAADNSPDSKEHEIEWLEDPFEQKTTPIVEKKADPTPPPAPAIKLDTAVVARKTVPLNTLINVDNVDEYFATVELKQAPDGVVRNPDDLKGFYIVRSVEAGQYLYKSLTGKEVVKEEKPAPAGPVAPPPEAKVTTKAKPRFPRLEQWIQGGGTARKVIWLEVAPNKWKRFDNDKEANDYNPDADDKSGSGGGQ